MEPQRGLTKLYLFVALKIVYPRTLPLTGVADDLSGGLEILRCLLRSLFEEDVGEFGMSFAFAGGSTRA